MKVVAVRVADKQDDRRPRRGHRCQLAEPRLVAGRDRQDHPLGREALRDGEPDPAAGARDQRDLRMRLPSGTDATRSTRSVSQGSRDGRAPDQPPVSCRLNDSPAGLHVGDAECRVGPTAPDAVEAPAAGGVSQSRRPSGLHRTTLARPRIGHKPNRDGLRGDRRRRCPGRRDNDRSRAPASQDAGARSVWPRLARPCRIGNRSARTRAAPVRCPTLDTFRIGLAPPSAPPRPAVPTARRPGPGRRRCGAVVRHGAATCCRHMVWPRLTSRLTRRTGRLDSRQTGTGRVARARRRRGDGRVIGLAGDVGNDCRRRRPAPGDRGRPAVVRLPTTPRPTRRRGGRRRTPWLASGSSLGGRIEAVAARPGMPGIGGSARTTAAGRDRRRCGHRDANPVGGRSCARRRPSSMDAADAVGLAAVLLRDKK